MKFSSAIAAGALLFATATSAADNETYIVQTGLDNTASVTQTGSSNLVGSVEAFTQSGDGANEATITQTGSNNVLQRGSQNAGQAGFPANVMTIEQTGDNNTLAKVNTSGVDNTLTYRQVGNNNGSLNNGSGNANAPSGGDAVLFGAQTINATSFVNQVGRFNDLSVSFEGDSNFGRFSQGDNNNTLTVGGLGGGNAFGDRNIVFGVQSGGDNIATIDLNGNDNVTLFSQEAGLNTIDATVDGDLNTMEVRQGTAGNMAVLNQIGNGNTMAIQQN